MRTMKKLKNEEAIVITKADKGNVLVIMYGESYNNEVENLLHPDTYIKLRKDPTENTTVHPVEELKDAKDPGKVHLHEARQSKAFAKISLAIGDEQQQHVQHLSSPKDVWEELERLFAPRDSKLRILQLRRQLYAEKLENCASVDAYLGRMNRIVSELVSIGDRIDDGDVAMTILCGLPKKWDVVVSSMCNLPESELSCATVKCRLLAEWQRRIDSDVSSVEADC
uniref:Retrotransposon gag domain-containing protein n=1 Tax=Trichuris muris TaxID=70415 RepID=A0A5S6QXI0_TRIMR